MKCFLFVVAAISTVGLPVTTSAEPEAEYRRLPLAEYRDKMAGGWIGQMLGVGWGAPTEFRYNGVIIPEENVPVWSPGMVNQYRQDDIYVEMTFLRSMEEHGFDVSIRQAGIDFANSGYRLWHANRYGRENLREGIAPPDSGHPKLNAHADDIDYQIEADYSGLIAPGMPNMGIALGEKFGRLMNYGDGLYGGQFVAGMYAEAFFEDDPKKLVEAGLACIPAESQYAETVRDVLAWHAEQPDDWQAVWNKIDAKYQRNPDYRLFSCNNSDENARPAFNIDAKINGAYIVMGLLYGDRDIEKTTVIAMRCGLDSDCNPSNAAGVLCTTMGMRQLPARFTSALDRTIEYSHTAYDFDALLDVCEKLARQAVVRQGGRIEQDASGNETLVIPEVAARPTPLEQCWEPGPASESRFTKEEMAQIDPPEPVVKPRAAVNKVSIAEAVEKFAPGWAVSDCGADMQPGLRAKWRARQNVLMTHPLSREKPCVLSRTVDIPSDKKTTLLLDVAHDPRGDWILVVKADGEVLAEQKISDESTDEGWTTVEIDLTSLAGKAAKIELQNRANGWKFEAAYWATIAIQSK